MITDRATADEQLLNFLPGFRAGTDQGKNKAPSMKIISPRRHPRRLPRHARRGRTLIEVLITVIILGIMTAVALPLYASSQKNSKLTACKANMTAIYQAEEAWRVRKRAYVQSTDTTNWPTIKTSLGGKPTCPADSANNDYTVTVTQGASATVGTNGTDGVAITSPSTVKVTITCSGGHTVKPVCVNGAFDVTGANEGTP